MESARQSNKPWGLLCILLGVVMFIMSWTSYTLILRILIALSSLVIIDYGMGLLAIPTLSEIIRNIFGKFFHKH